MAHPGILVSAILVEPPALIVALLWSQLKFSPCESLMADWHRLLCFLWCVYLAVLLRERAKHVYHFFCFHNQTWSFMFDCYIPVSGSPCYEKVVFFFFVLPQVWWRRFMFFDLPFFFFFFSCGIPSVSSLRLLPSRRRGSGTRLLRLPRSKRLRPVRAARRRRQRIWLSTPGRCACFGRCAVLTYRSDVVAFALLHFYP